jgi:hypothetical protein
LRYQCFYITSVPNAISMGLAPKDISSKLVAMSTGLTRSSPFEGSQRVGWCHFGGHCRISFKAPRTTVTIPSCSQARNCLVHGPGPTPFIKEASCTTYPHSEESGYRSSLSLGCHPIRPTEITRSMRSSPGLTGIYALVADRLTGPSWPMPGPSWPSARATVAHAPQLTVLDLPLGLGLVSLASLASRPHSASSVCAKGA